METNTVWPISNPDEFPLCIVWKLQLEHPMMIRIMSQPAGSYASNVSFPEESDLDEFIAADCQAIGDGSRFYEIVNESDLEDGYLN